MKVRLFIWLCWLSVFGPGVTSGEEAPPPARFSVDAFTVTGENPLSANDTQRILDAFAGDHEGLDGLLAAADALESAILEAGHSFHRVILPPQTLDAGTVSLAVVVFRLNEIEVSGNRHFSRENILRSFPSLEIGAVPRTRELARTLRVANQHPAKNATLKFSESETAQAIDAEIAVTDRKPWQIVAALDNTGSDTSGDYRLALAFQHNNLFDRDHAVTVSRTTSPGHFGDVQQTGLSYNAPLYPLTSSLALYYVESSVDTGVVDGFDISGSGRFWGLQLTKELLKIGRYNHHVSLGISNKFFENNVLFEGEGESLLPDVRSVPLTLEYGGDLSFSGGRMGFSVSYSKNVTTGDDNRQEIYEVSTGRNGTDVHWDLFRASLDIERTLPRDWALRAVLEGQWANEPLIAGEQFGVGGANSVRGFEEREVVGDDGIRGSMELWSPPLPHNMRALGFFDAGRVLVNNPLAGTQGSDFVASIGLGLRWQVSEYVSLTADAGYVLEGSNVADDPSEDGHKQIHATLLVRY